MVLVGYRIDYQKTLNYQTRIIFKFWHTRPQVAYTTSGFVLRAGRVLFISGLSYQNIALFGGFH